MTLIGYVITNDNTGSEKGFFALFPSLFVRVHNRFKPVTSRSWDHWSVRKEMEHRRCAHSRGAYAVNLLNGCWAWHCHGCGRYLSD